jgi:hypothetical protein
MPASTLPDVTKNPTLNNGQKETTIEKESIKVKEIKFHELVNWLEKWGYKVIDKTKENKIEGIEFQAEVYPLLPYSSGANTPLFLEFQNDLEEGLIIRTTFEIDKDIESHLKKQNMARATTLTYIEIEQIVLPMKVSMIRSHPQINLYKVVFYDGLKKQYFFDCIINLINSMSIIIDKWDAKYYEIKTKTLQSIPRRENRESNS